MKRTSSLLALQRLLGMMVTEIAIHDDTVAVVFGHSRDALVLNEATVAMGREAATKITADIERRERQQLAQLKAKYES